MNGSTPATIALGLGLAGILLGGTPKATPGQAKVQLVSEVALPHVLRFAMDVRWAGERSVYIAAGQAGTFEFQLDSPRTAKPVLAGGSGEREFWLSSRVALTPSFLVVASPVYAVRSRHRQTGRDQTLSFEAIVDLDAREDRLLLLGAKRDNQGRFATDGAMAWLGSLSRDLGDLKPVYFSSSGPGAKTLDNCGPFEMGAVRFLQDGSFLIVPGVEPGAYLYKSDGKLSHTWDTARAGLDTRDCERLDAKLRVRLFADPDARFAWVNQRRTLDEILVLPDGPGLVVRRVAGGRASWDLKVLSSAGEVSSLALPISASTAHSHLRGDVRGNKAALLVFEYGKNGPAVPPRLIVAQLAKG